MSGRHQATGTITVRLTRDHARYHPSLRRGATGETVPPRKACPDPNDWTTVRFGDLSIEVRWRYLSMETGR